MSDLKSPSEIIRDIMFSNKEEIENSNNDEDNSDYSKEDGSYLDKELLLKSTLCIIEAIEKAHKDFEEANNGISLFQLKALLLNPIFVFIDSMQIPGKSEMELMMMKRKFVSGISTTFDRFSRKFSFSAKNSIFENEL